MVLWKAKIKAVDFLGDGAIYYDIYVVTPDGTTKREVLFRLATYDTLLQAEINKVGDNVILTQFDSSKQETNIFYCKKSCQYIIADTLGKAIPLSSPYESKIEHIGSVRHANIW